MKIRLPDALVALGQVLDVVIEHNGRRMVLDFPKPPHWLCTDIGRQALYLLPIPKGHRGQRFPAGAGGQLGALASVFRTWSDFEPRRASLVTTRLGREWKARGRVVRIGYRSDKWTNKPTDYEHDFKAQPRIAQLGTLYRISGSRLKVTAAGITG